MRKLKCFIHKKRHESLFNVRDCIDKKYGGVKRKRSLPIGMGNVKEGEDLCAKDCTTFTNHRPLWRGISPLPQPRIHFN